MTGNPLASTKVLVLIQFEIPIARIPDPPGGFDFKKSLPFNRQIQIVPRPLHVPLLEDGHGHLGFSAFEPLCRLGHYFRKHRDILS